jgi:hypothetical protein
MNLEISMLVTVVFDMPRERVYGGDRGYKVSRMGITQTKVASLTQQ